MHYEEQLPLGELNAELKRLNGKQSVPIMMPFGKHRGKPFAKIPVRYLKWLLRECDLRPELREAIETALD